MDKTYWDLFWRTGMPEAWLMSRGGEGPHQAAPESRPGDVLGLFGPLASAQSRMSDNSPGGPEKLY